MSAERLRNIQNSFEKHIDPLIHIDRKYKSTISAALQNGLLIAALHFGYLEITDPYTGCGVSTNQTVSSPIKIAAYEEFPTLDRMKSTEKLPFQIKVAIAAHSYEEFQKIKQGLETDGKHTQIREFVFWPLLSEEEGYYPGPFSDPSALKRVAHESDLAAQDGIEILWDLEFPPGTFGILRFFNFQWAENRDFIDSWLKNHDGTVHIWRSYKELGLNPWILRTLGLHFDPNNYSNVTMHLDLHTTGDGIPENDMRQILLCGKEQYRDHFVPSFGSLDDGFASPDVFVPPETLQRDIQLAQASGISEIWVFSVSGLQPKYTDTLQKLYSPENNSHFQR